MSVIENEDLLSEEHEHVEKSSEMADGSFARMVPESVDGCPSEVVAVVLDQNLPETSVESQMTKN